MIRIEALFGVIALGLWVFSLIDVISSDEGWIRHLPKLYWVLIVLLFPLVGSIAWLVAGRPEKGVAGAGRSPHERAAPSYPEYDRPGRAAATDAGADDEFLRQVRERAEQQREAYRRRQREQGE